MDAAEIAGLREINEKATQGEWTPRIHSPGLGGAHIRAEIHQCNIADIAEGTASSMGEVTRADCVANAAYIAAFDPPTTRSLLDALEQAQKDIQSAEAVLAASIDRNIQTLKAAERLRARAEAVELERNAAQQDAKDARALAYEECAKLIEDNMILFCGSGPNELRPRMEGDRTGLDYVKVIRARIEAMLEKKP